MARETLYDDFLAFERKHSLFAPGDGVVAAVSGGPDSVALLDILRQLSSNGRIRLAACHLNHQLRGAEADGDERFVEELCASMGVPLEVGRRDVAALARDKGLSVETAAREARYEFFDSAVRKHKARCVATAHTMSDEAETVIQRLIEGAGPEGLTGIPVKRPLGKWTDVAVVRPLLFATRGRIMEYLSARGLSSRTDSTNLEPLYLRNRIRLEVLPKLREFNPSIEEALARVAESMDIMYDFVWNEVRDQWHRVVVSDKPHVFLIRRRELLGIHGAVAREIVKEVLARADVPARDIKAAHIEAIMCLAESRKPSARLELPGGIVIRRDYDSIRVAHATAFPEEPGRAAEETSAAGADEPTAFEELLDLDGIVTLPDGHWIEAARYGELSKEDIRDLKSAGKTPNQELLDAFAVKRPLVVRYPRPGDRYKPLGCRGEKKLSDIFIDAKVPAEKRATIPVVEDRQGIVWVVGFRIADRVKLRGPGRCLLLRWRQRPKS